MKLSLVAGQAISGFHPSSTGTIKDLHAPIRLGACQTSSEPRSSIDFTHLSNNIKTLADYFIDSSARNRLELALKNIEGAAKRNTNIHSLELAREVILCHSIMDRLQMGLYPREELNALTHTNLKQGDKPIFDYIYHSLQLEKRLTPYTGSSYDAIGKIKLDQIEPVVSAILAHRLASVFHGKSLPQIESLLQLNKLRVQVLAPDLYQTDRQAMNHIPFGRFLSAPTQVIIPFVASTLDETLSSWLHEIAHHIYRQNKLANNSKILLMIEEFKEALEGRGVTDSAIVEAYRLSKNSGITNINWELYALAIEYALTSNPSRLTDLPRLQQYITDTFGVASSDQGAPKYQFPFVTINDAPHSYASPSSTLHSQSEQPPALPPERVAKRLKRKGKTTKVAKHRVYPSPVPTDTSGSYRPSLNIQPPGSWYDSALMNRSPFVTQN